MAASRPSASMSIPQRRTSRSTGSPGVGAARAYVALHKPAGVTATTHDRHAEVTVLDLIPTALIPDGTRLYPVGRLDQDSEGLLLLTNDGTWADHVLHPRFGVQREYAIALARPLDQEQAAALRKGVSLEEGLALLAAPLRPATAVETRTLERLLDPAPDHELTWYRTVLAQGWKRQLRRMFGAVGAPIQRLVRVRIGTVRLDGLETGRARLLKAPEIRQLGAVPGATSARGGPPTSPKADGPRRPAPILGQRPGGPRRPRPKAAPAPKGSPPAGQRPNGPAAAGPRDPEPRRRGGVTRGNSRPRPKG